jgi:hypothetical protein
LDFFSINNFNSLITRLVLFEEIVTIPSILVKCKLNLAVPGMQNVATVMMMPLTISEPEINKFCFFLSVASATDSYISRFLERPKESLQVLHLKLFPGFSQDGGSVLYPIDKAADTCKKFFLFNKEKK